MATREDAWTNMGFVALAAAAAARAAEKRCESLDPGTPPNEALAAAFAAMADAFRAYADASRDSPTQQQCLWFPGPTNGLHWYDPITGEWGEPC
ncbi:MAG: hypothetical protein ACTS3F_05425 [Phycisphaerales bacterium]